jgi:hypothetical protein
MKIDWMLTILVCAVVLTIYSFWHAQKNPTFDFNCFDLLMVNGKVDKTSVAFMLVLGVTTWLMVDLQIKSKMTEAYFLAYSGAWIAPLVAKIVFGKTEMPGTTTTSTTSITQATTEKVAP